MVAASVPAAPAEEGARLLHTIVAANLFIVPLDEAQHWYRYQHLFAEALRARAQQRLAAELPSLHRRAATWFIQQGLDAEAVPHLVAVEDFVWAGRVIEQLGDALLWESGKPETLRGWLTQFPAAVIQEHPKLCLLYAWTLYATGQPDAVEPWLLRAESHLRTPADTTLTGPVLRTLLGETVAIRALVSSLQDTPGETLTLTRWALDMLTETAPHLRGLLTAAQAEAAYLSRDVDTASQGFRDAHQLCWTSGNRFLALMCLARLAAVQVLQGRLHEAMATCQHLRRLVAAPEEALSFVAGWAEATSATVLCEWNVLDTAAEHAQRAVSQGRLASDSGLVYQSLLTLARVQEALGQLDAAHATLREAVQLESQQAPAGAPSREAAAAYQARLWLAQGKVAEAAHWAHEHGWQEPEALSLRHDVVHLTRARLWLAQGKAAEAAALLERLRQAAAAGGHTGVVIEALVLLALALQEQRHADAALETLRQALTLAAPEGYIRVFVDAGAPMTHLLAQAAARQILPAYVETLRAACAASYPAPLRAPLSPREGEVLTFLVAGLTTDAIAQQLFIAPNTVKVHLRRIYRKLAVTSRSHAVARAKDLGLA